MPGILSEEIAVQFPLLPLMFCKAQVPISQSAVAMNTIESRATTGTLNITDIVMPFPGSIVAVSVSGSANFTAGNLTVDVTINGTVTGIQAKIPGVFTLPDKRGYGSQVANKNRFNAGDTLGVKYTSDGSLAPTTNDIIVWVWALNDLSKFQY